MIHVDIEDEMRPCAYGDRRRLAPKPQAWMSTVDSRMTIGVRDHLRANTKGKELALQLAPKGVPVTTPGAPIVIHASDSSRLGEVTSGSCVGIVGEGSATEKEKKLVE